MDEYSKKIIKFDYARPYYNGLAVVANKYKGYDRSFYTHIRPIDVGGDCDWTDFNADSLGDFKNGYSIIKQDGKYGIISTNSDVIVYVIYDGIGSFNNGYVKVLHNNKWKILNPYGECIKNCDSTDNTNIRNENNLSTLFFTNYNIELSASSKQKLKQWASEIQKKTNKKYVIIGNGNSCNSSQQNSWDCTNATRKYLVDVMHINPEQIIFQYGGNGEYRTVNIREAKEGEEGPNNVPPPFPSYRNKIIINQE